MQSTTQTWQWKSLEMKSTHPCICFDIAQAVISHLLSLKFSTFRLKDVYDTILFYLLVLQN